MKKSTHSILFKITFSNPETSTSVKMIFKVLLGSKTISLSFRGLKEGTLYFLSPENLKKNSILIIKNIFHNLLPFKKCGMAFLPRSKIHAL